MLEFRIAGDHHRALRLRCGYGKSIGIGNTVVRFYMGNGKDGLLCCRKDSYGQLLDGGKRRLMNTYSLDCGLQIQPGGNFLSYAVE